MEILQHQTDQRNAEKEINEQWQNHTRTEACELLSVHFFSFLLKRTQKGLNLEDEGAKSHKSWRITSKLQTPHTHPQTKRGTLSPRRVFPSGKARILKRARRERRRRPDPKSRNLVRIWSKTRRRVSLGYGLFKIKPEVNGWFQPGLQNKSMFFY